MRGTPKKRRAGSAEFTLAELSRFYGFDLTDAPPDKLFTFAAAMPGLEAKRRLKERGFRAFDAKTVYDLMLMATGNRAEAEKAQAEREQAEMDEMDRIQKR